jgi:hypothetical protein
MNQTFAAAPVGKPLYQTLDSLTPGQVAAIREIPAHDQTFTPQIEATRPASIFTSQARYDLEQAKVFRGRAGDALGHDRGAGNRHGP